ncbi:MAG: hypothetical protein GF364_19835 [Candidatus Lokiarchaeota archaeon]|nr:hypothetical protein [Candidatus Lokiarchaeota archaeon]
MKVRAGLNILICGIGGQGAVLLGNLLRELFLYLQPNSIVSGTESRGVSQREGSVISTVRVVWSNKNNSRNSDVIIGPEIGKHGADIVIALEPIEFLRNLDYIHSNTLMLVNSNQIPPKNTLVSQLKTPYSVEYNSGQEMDEVYGRSPNGLENLDLTSNSLLDMTIRLLDHLTLNSPMKILDPELKGAEIEVEVDALDRSLHIPNELKINVSLHPKYMENSTEIKKHPFFDVNLHYVDFTQPILEVFESSSLLNLVMLGYLSPFISNIASLEQIEKFIKNYFSSFKNADKMIERNIQSFRFGRYINKLARS